MSIVQLAVVLVVVIAIAAVVLVPADCNAENGASVDVEFFGHLHHDAVWHFPPPGLGGSIPLSDFLALQVGQFADSVPLATRGAAISHAVSGVLGGRTPTQIADRVVISVIVAVASFKAGRAGAGERFENQRMDFSCFAADANGQVAAPHGLFQRPPSITENGACANTGAYQPPAGPYRAIIPGSIALKPGDVTILDGRMSVRHGHHISRGGCVQGRRLLPTVA
jgi:hypothetical protein